jgi:hypothetical protein
MKRKNKEIWKDIKGFEGRYQVSNLGNVKSLDRLIWNGSGMQLLKSKILKPQTKHAYLRVSLYNGDGMITRQQPSIHRLVAESFIPNPKNYPMVLHGDNEPKNNNVNNLRWGNQSENMKQMWKDNRKTYEKK